jgi:hypothetical protein
MKCMTSQQTQISWPTVGPSMVKVGIQLAEAPDPSQRFADYNIKVGL